MTIYDGGGLSCQPKGREVETASGPYPVAAHADWAVATEHADRARRAVEDLKAMNTDAAMGVAMDLDPEIRIDNLPTDYVVRDTPFIESAEALEQLGEIVSRGGPF